MSPRRVFEVGERYGMLTVIERNDVCGSPPQAVRCRCDCGKETLASRRGLASAGSGKRSCGCQLGLPGAANSNWRGGRRTHPLYVTYWGMHDRCSNPNNKRYSGYGGRGITICQRWRDDFWAFVADMGERPPRTTIDRIDNDGNYEPGNCRWATASQQARNKRDESLAQIRALNVTRAKAQKAATECHVGHEYTAENTYVNPNTKYRSCRKCVRISRARARANSRRAA